jgi:hypothetical protein
MRRWLISWALFFTLADVMLCQRVQTADILSEKQTLTNQKSMSVVVDMVSLPGYDPASSIESMLRQIGITVQPYSERSPTYPLLRMSVESNILQQFQQVNYCATLEFVQLYRLGNGTNVSATTWSAKQHGLLPWNGLLDTSATAAGAGKAIATLVQGFLDDWREVNGGTSAQSGRAAEPSGRFDGVWRGTYSCTGGFGGGGTLVWVIHEVQPGTVQVQEQWSRFIMSGRVSYSGRVGGQGLDVKTRDMGGYEVRLVLSADGSTLNGQYIGHPNQCQTMTLQRAQ